VNHLRRRPEKGPIWWTAIKEPPVSTRPVPLCQLNDSRPAGFSHVLLTRLPARLTVQPFFSRSVDLQILLIIIGTDDKCGLQLWFPFVWASGLCLARFICLHRPIERAASPPSCDVRPQLILFLFHDISFSQSCSYWRLSRGLSGYSLFEFYRWGIACAAVGAPQLEFNLRTERNARFTQKYILEIYLYRTSQNHFCLRACVEKSNQNPKAN